MNEFYSIANRRIKKLIDDLTRDASEVEKTLTSEEEKGKLALNLLYYKIVLQGCIRYVYDVKKYVEVIQDSAIGEGDFNLILDKYCDNVDVPSDRNIVLDENPRMNMKVSSVSKDNDIILDENPQLNMKIDSVTGDNDIVLDKNPRLKTKVSKISGGQNKDIVLGDNPKMQTKVSYVSKDNDIILDENPSLKMNISRVSKDNKNIEFDENPELKIKVSSITGDNDIILDENPELDIDISKVSKDIDSEDFYHTDGFAEAYDENDIVLDENPELNIKIAEVTKDEDNKDSKELPLFGALNFKVKKVSKGDTFDLASFNASVKANREKQKSSVKDDDK